MKSAVFWVVLGLCVGTPQLKTVVVEANKPLFKQFDFLCSIIVCSQIPEDVSLDQNYADDVVLVIPADFEKECSVHGTLISGKCHCNEGYDGALCETGLDA